MNEHNISFSSISDFIPPHEHDFYNKNIEVHYLGYYLNWVPQEVYYYSVKNCNFIPRPFRSDGTYTKFSSIDDQFDDLYWYSVFIKFGIGRTTYNVADDIRNNHITLDEGKSLINLYDGEKLHTYLNNILDYLEINEDQFEEHINKFRSPHLWGETSKGEYKLRHNVNKNGLDD